MSSREKLVGLGVAILAVIGIGYGLFHVFHTTGSTSTSPPPTPVVIQVTIANDPTTVGKYVPAAIRVLGNRDESIEFKNDSSTTHTVTEVHGRFNTGNIPAGGTATLRLSAPGLYHYYCKLHPGMTGTINVLIKRQPRSTS